MFEKLLDWRQFGMLKHWIRTGDLNIIKITHDDIKLLQEVCLYFGMDKLSQTLYNMNQTRPCSSYNPQKPEDDYKKLYEWACLNLSNADDFVYSNIEEFCWKNMLIWDINVVKVFIGEN